LQWCCKTSTPIDAIAAAPHQPFGLLATGGRVMENVLRTVKPTVSVLMVTYNHEPYIAQAVESALAQQTTFPVEIVIGEDHSTDRTREIVRDLQRDHRKKIRLLLHPKNLGGAANVA